MDVERRSFRRDPGRLVMARIPKAPPARASRHLSRLRRRRRRRRLPSAAGSPEDFSAAASDYHFSAPRALQAELPEVAAHLRRLYGASPFM